MTPIYFRESGLAFGWFSNETGEPPHVHVFRGKGSKHFCKVLVE